MENSSNLCISRQYLRLEGEAERRKWSKCSGFQNEMAAIGRAASRLFDSLARSLLGRTTTTLHARREIRRAIRIVSLALDCSYVAVSVSVFRPHWLFNLMEDLYRFRYFGNENVPTDQATQRSIWIHEDLVSGRPPRRARS